LVLVALQLVGCDILGNLIQEDGKSSLEELLNKKSEEEVVSVSTDIQGEQIVNLYFADESGEYLVEKQRSIPKTLSLARETVNQWLMGPLVSSSDCFGVVDPSSTLLDINIKNGVATVDLSKEFLQPYGNVSAQTALYGLINTVGQFSTVEIVKIRVEGQELEAYRGLELNNLRFRDDLICFSGGPVTNEPLVTGQEGYELENEVPNMNGDFSNENEDVLSPSSVNIFAN